VSLEPVDLPDGQRLWPGGPEITLPDGRIAVVSSRGLFRVRSKMTVRKLGLNKSL
jgi:hypothetical protein